MNETFSQYWSKAVQYWQRTSKTQRIVFFTIIAFALITIFLIIYNLAKTEYSLAYTDLSPTDAAAIKNYLESKGIPYEFGPDGTSIGVPTKLVTDVKIEVAAQNLIQDGSQGFGIFRDNLSGFGMTDNEFNVLNADARAGELQKLINAYEGVQRAQVLLTIPEESVFINAGEQDEASASAVVTFKPGFRPKQQMIDGIYNLIKTGVPNLPLANITVTDQNGTLLPPSELSGGMAGASSLIEQHLQIKKMVEADIQKSIKSYLGTIYGNDRVVVSVIATLNFDQVNAQSRTFTPVNEEKGTGIIRSEQIEERSSSSEGGTSPGGVVGTGGTDVPTYPGAEASRGNSETEELIATRNYEINEMTRSIVSSPYVVRDLTIFAGIEPPDPADPDSLSQAELAEIRRILSNVVGTSLANNSDRTFTPEEIESRVSVIAQSFRGTAAQPAAATNAAWYYAIGGAGLALAAAAGTAIALHRRRQRQLAALRAAEELERASAPVEIPSIDLDQMGSEHQIRRQLESLAKRKPEEFVNLLRTWLADE